MRRVEESSDLLTAPAYGKLVRYLSKKYDFVIIDAPPVISLADTQIIAEHADWAIFVVKNQKTRDRLVSMAIRRLMETGVTVVGTVLCQVRASESRSDEIYGYYYG
jgi:Mrp family chromosome partitioning ATPase